MHNRVGKASTILPAQNIVPFIALTVSHCLHYGHAVTIASSWRSNSITEVVAVWATEDHYTMQLGTGGCTIYTEDKETKPIHSLVS